jgi:imidazolonepropionase-like amidohydrolase
MALAKNLIAFNQPLLADKSYALTGGRIFDATAGIMLENRVLLIHGRQILALCSAEDLAQDTPCVDITGHSVLPGLIDVHVHTEDWHAPLYLAHGITTVRDVGCDLEDVLERRSQWNASDSAPRLLCTGPVIDRPGSTWDPLTRRIQTPQDARLLVDELTNAGVDQIKTYTLLDLPCYQAVVDQAHKRGRFVLSHLGRFVDARQAIQAGTDEIEHLSGVSEALWWEASQASQDWIWIKLWAEMDSQRLGSLIDLILERGTWMAITRLVWLRLAYAWDTRLADHPQMKYIPPALLQFWDKFSPQNAQKRAFPSGMPPPSRQDRCQQVAGMAIFTAELFRRGARILIGTDTPFPNLAPGFSFHDEMYALLECGLSEAAALQAATLSGAQALGISDQVGTLAAAKLADLSVVAGDPTRDFKAMSQVRAVARQGHWLDPAALLVEAAGNASQVQPPKRPRFDATY